MSSLIATDIEAYLAQHERKELLRFLTCGSVDDGKSTLIGRMLYDSKMIYEDQLAAVRRDSAVHGTTGGDFDPALLTDGLKAEREQGITIDVAYRYFSTTKRKFIIADTPGHEQYTRNMATGASTCDLAIILIDARRGVLTQTKRHSFIVSLLGIKHVIVAINKMDLVDYSQETYERIKQDYSDFAARLVIDDIHFIPLAALPGENVVEPSARMPWYNGGTLMHLLENVHIASDRNLIDFRFPVQYVSRPDGMFRGFSGTIASGVVRVGDEVIALPSRKTSRIREIVTQQESLPQAFAPQAITLTLEDEIDISRGDMIVHPANMPNVDSRFEAMLVWMDDEPLVPGKQYLIKHTTRVAPGSISNLRYRVDVNTLSREPAASLRLNEIGRCAITVNQPLLFDDYRRNRATGALIVIDRLSNRTVGAGMILDRHTSEQSRDHWDDASQGEWLQGQTGRVAPDERRERLDQQAATILLTGLTGSGKSTIAYALDRYLFDVGRSATVLDGENLRLGISRDLGFTAEDRSENLRRGIEVARLMNDAGMIAICSFLAPHDAVRQKARERIGSERFFLVHLSAPVEVCRERATGGVYQAADRGEIANFPGVSSTYEDPTNPNLVLPTHEWPVARCVDAIVDMLRKHDIIPKA